MRTFWIVVGVIVVLWIGFLHVNNNEIRTDLDNHLNERMDLNEYDGTKGNTNFGREVGDEVDDAGEEIREGIPSTETQLQDEKQDLIQERKERKYEKKQNIQNDVSTGKVKGEAITAYVSYKTPKSNTEAKEAYLYFDKGVVMGQ